MLGKSAIIDFLVSHNIGDVYYLPGIHTLSLSKILNDTNINVFIARHEANMAFMADGYVRASGHIGVVIVTPGPGLGNVISGCMEAYGDDIPLLIIHIDTERKDIGKGILHELVDPENMFRHVTKRAFIVRNREDMVKNLELAYNSAMEGRRGPVLISIPYRLLEKEVALYEHTEVEPVSPCQSENFSRFDDVLAQKKKPVLIGGKSLMFEQARPILDTICRDSSIPFLTTTSGKGILDEKSLWCFGNIMQKGVVKEIVSSADVVIAIGTRLRDVDAKRRGVKIQELVHIDIDQKWFDKNYPASFKAVGEILPFLHHLKEVVKGKKYQWNIQKLKEAQFQERQEIYSKHLGIKLVELLEESIPENTTTIWDLNLAAYWAEYYFSVHHQRTFIMPRGTSPIFYALPAAIGAKIARPENPCLAVCGDGSILPTICELSTIRKYNIPVVILVYNNNSFGILEDYMRETYSLESTMSLVNPDFIKIASTFGIHGKRVKTLHQLRRTIRESVQWDEPYLLEFSGPVFPPPWRM